MKIDATIITKEDLKETTQAGLRHQDQYIDNLAVYLINNSILPRIKREAKLGATQIFINVNSIENMFSTIYNVAARYQDENQYIKSILIDTLPEFASARECDKHFEDYFPKGFNLKEKLISCIRKKIIEDDHYSKMFVLSDGGISYMYIKWNKLLEEKNGKTTVKK